MGKLLIGKVAFTPRGQYDATISYDKYDMVWCDLMAYISMHSGNRGNTPPSFDSEGSGELEESTHWKPLLGAEYVTTWLLAEGAVTTNKIDNYAVISAKIADNAIQERHIVDNAVSERKLSGTKNGQGEWLTDPCVSERTIQDGAVTTDKISGGMVTIDGVEYYTYPAVTTEKLADNAVTEHKILNYSVTEDKISGGSYSTEQGTVYTPPAVTTNKIANNAVTTDKISGGMVDGTYYDPAVTTAKIADLNVTEAKIDDKAVTTFKIADYNVTTRTIDNYAVTTDKLSGGDYVDPRTSETVHTLPSVTREKIEDRAVTEDKLSGVDDETGPAVTEDKLSGSRDPITHEWTTDPCVTEDKIADYNVTEDKIAPNAVTAGKIAPNAVVEGCIADDAVVAGNIAPNAVVLGCIADDAVVAGNIAANAVTADAIQDGAITAEKFDSQGLVEYLGTIDALPTSGSIKAVQSGGVFNALQAIINGTKVTLSVSPSTVVFAGTSYTLSGTMSGSTASSMKLYESGVQTPIKTGTTSVTSDAISTTANVASSKSYRLVGETQEGFEYTASTTVYAVNHIYYGFGSSATYSSSLVAAVIADTHTTSPAAKRSAAGTYTGTAFANDQKFYIIVPKEGVSDVNTFKMGGGDFVMETRQSYTDGNGVEYWVHRSGSIFDTGGKVNVTAS